MTHDNTHWWRHGIIYQIYPRSYQDSNTDGIGDLPGIIQRLDYLQWLGVDAIWLSPIYPSPMADFGYDVADYTDVNSIFGTLDDVDALIEAAHERGLRMILDYVPNHSSDQHPWFLESRSSRDNPRRDWYIWRDPAPDGGPPNNWLSRFDGLSAWEWDETTQQYYYHTFLPEQPELNWRNPEVRHAMLDVLRFWFERGIDGFRIDVVSRIMKDEQLRDNPPNPDWREGMDPAGAVIERYTNNLPEVHEVIRQMRAVADEHEGRLLIGELHFPLSELVKYYGDNDELHLPFNFWLIYSPWDSATVRGITDRYEGLLPANAWPNWVLGNHDQHRFASRVGPAQARVGMMLLLTLRGTPTIYYGDEIGMHDVAIPPNRVQDPWEKNVPGLGLGRDPERTPMQWDGSPNAGFCPPTVEPWLPIADDYEQINVAVERDDPRSMLALTSVLIRLRRANSAFIAGEYRSLDAPEDIFAYLRESDGSRFAIALNFSSTPKMWALPETVGNAAVVLSTHMDRVQDNVAGTLELRGDEGLILRC